MVDDPRVAIGLPESLVGLLPGAGGTQRLPRLAGVAAALPVLLEGARLAGREALAAGVVDELVSMGGEVEAAERWVLANRGAAQPWDRAGWRPKDGDRTAALLAKERERILASTLGHYPAPLAILDCMDQGLPQAFDEAIRSEMRIFSKLIQRREPRNMIRTLFLGRLDHDRLVKAGGIAPRVEAAVSAIAEALQVDGREEPMLLDALARAGFRGIADRVPSFDGAISGDAFWHDAEPDTKGKQALRARLARVHAVADAWRPQLTAEECRAADFLLVKNVGFPTYLGGVLATG